MNTDFDIAVVGSGFGGSLMAMIARRLGRSVVMLERGKHPRFAIGESSTPLANLLLEALARRYDLPEVASLAKWGTWQQKHPEIACGLKRGFTFYHHTLGQPWTAKPDRSNELLVAASPHDAIADTHWHRPDFDHFLVGEAQRIGVEYLDETKLEDAQEESGGVILRGDRNGRRVEIRARWAWAKRPSNICRAPRRSIRTSPGSNAGTPRNARTRRHRIPSMTRRCITSSTADGSGFCVSTTA